MTIGDMTVIVFSSPVVTNFIAHFLVGEPCGIFFVFTAILTLCGVGLITKPPFLTGSSTFDYNTSVSSHKKSERMENFNKIAKLLNRWEVLLPLVQCSASQRNLQLHGKSKTRTTY